ncbi:MAG: glycosyltransferase family 2 protein [Clostridiales bacterium]|nr:glycosyltransferase family 2 protein [Clostridiales bacterium]
MNQNIWEVRRERFSLDDCNAYLLQGYFPKNYYLEVRLDSQIIQGELEEWIPASSVERFKSGESADGNMVEVTVHLPENFRNYSLLNIYAILGSQRILWFSVKVKNLARRWRRPQYFIEEELVNVKERSCRIRGWAVGRGLVAIKIFDDQKKEIPCEIQMTNRSDVTEMFHEYKVEPKCGFYMELNQLQGRNLYLVFHTKDSTVVHKISLIPAVIFKNIIEKYGRKAFEYLRVYGSGALLEKTRRKITTLKNRPPVYNDWLKKHLPTEAELEVQRSVSFQKEPKISLVVPLFRTEEKYLRELVASVKAQTYRNWELCLSDGSGADSPIAGVLKELATSDSRIRLISHEKPLKIAENTNAAISVATGDWIAFGDHDDVLTPDAFYQCVRRINEDGETDVIYTDEDKMSMDGHRFFQPSFKPDYNPDLLCSVNYICHLFVVKRVLLEETGLLRPEFEGAQDYDLILRCVEKTEHIAHIPRICYHWRCHENSTSENPESKRYAFEAGLRAVQAHYDRMGIRAEVRHGEFLGLYRTRYIRPEDPKISILIPNKDHTEDLERCISSIEVKSAYKNLEYIVIENNSEEEKTFAYYRQLETKNPRVKVVYYKGTFNFSAINNFGEKYASGDYLLLLNNDTEVINKDCLEEILGYCMRPDVGAVGARLYYEDNTIQHAGVVIGFGGIAGHCFVQQPRSATGYCHRIITAQDYSAVTAACMMVKKSVYEEVGGLTEELAVAFNDIDFCLKIRKAGYLIVYNPYAELYHYESKSRGLEDTPEKVERFQKEVYLMGERWKEILRDGDPYYSPNLTLESQDFSLKRLS